MVGNVREKTEPTPGSTGEGTERPAAPAPTFPAKIAAILLAAARAVVAPLRVPRQLRAGRPSDMHNYKFQAVVAVIPPQDAVRPPGPDWHGPNTQGPDWRGPDWQGPDSPGPNWRGIIRARSCRGRSHGMFNALVTDWVPAGPLGAGVSEPHAVATIVAYGPDPAESLPVGGTFALWRGRDMGLGVVTRRLYV